MNLNKEFYLNKVKQDELEMVFLNYFGSGSGPDNDNKSTYSREKEAGCLVILSYDKKGIISSVDGGPGLTDKHIAEIKDKILEELINNQDVLVGYEICYVFSNQIGGYFRYKDKFQILPLPPDAPKIEIDTIVGNRPILLEYKYISSKNLLVSNARKSKVVRELIPLLHILSKRRLYGPRRYMDFEWALKNEEGKEPTSEYTQIGFFYGKKLSTPESFSSVKDVSPLPFGKSRSNELVLLENTNDLLDKVFSLDPKNYLKFMTACYWFYTANEVWKISHSVSYVCLVTSIECLMNEVEKCKCGSAKRTPSIEICDLCGEPQYRIGKTFKDFLETHASEEFSKLSKQEKSYVYDIRSTMLHGEKLFLRDSEPMGFLGFQKSYESEFHRVISSLVVSALTSWLNKTN